MTTARPTGSSVPVSPAHEAQRRDVAGFFLLAFGLTWACWVPAGLVTRGDLTLPVPPLLLVVVGGFGPLVAAVVMSGRRDGRAGVRRLFAQLDPRRAPKGWFAAPLILVATNLAPVVTHVAAGGDLPDSGTVLSAVLTMPLQLLVVCVVGGGLDEETGWRGYALPQLLRSAPPVVGHAVLGVLWACWHLPLWLDPSSSQGAYPFGLYLAITVGHSVLIGWMYSASGGCLAVAVLAHAASNSSDGLRYQLLGDARGQLENQLTLLAAVAMAATLVVLLTRGRVGADGLDLSRTP